MTGRGGGLKILGGRMKVFGIGRPKLNMQGVLIGIAELTIRNPGKVEAEAGKFETGAGGEAA